jgi:hypothetical protein
MQDPDVLQEQKEWEDSLEQRQSLTHHDHTASKGQGQAPHSRQELGDPGHSALKKDGEISKIDVDKSPNEALPKGT